MKAFGTLLPTEGFPRSGRDGSLLWGPGVRGGKQSLAWRLPVHVYSEASLWRQVRSPIPFGQRMPLNATFAGWLDDQDRQTSLLSAEVDGGCLEQLGEPTHTQLCRQLWSNFPLLPFSEVGALTIQMSIPF